MEIKRSALFFLSSFLLVGTHSLAQMKEGKKFDELEKENLNWFNQDPTETKIQGVSVDLAYNTILKNTTPKKTIIVAVIDGGVDIEHEDLQGQIWTNIDEIPNNGIDDDNNGYVDDIHGWNFIGNSNSENIRYENYEYVRIYRDLKGDYDNLTSTDNLNEQQLQEYVLFKECKAKYKEELEKYTKLQKNIKNLKNKIADCDDIFKTRCQLENYTEEDIKSIHSTDPSVNRAKRFMQYLYKQGFTEELLSEEVERADQSINYHLNVDFNSRQIIHDDVEDINDNKYGNNDVTWERCEHGTFVSGIIAANRDNQIGINGIAENVQIMALRTVPVGDELDKDVALSIRYAVDNGAQIINMSFGKDYSPNKGLVYDAIKYASDHGVLLVHAAGNDGINTDEEVRYPNDKISENTFAKTWIEVGAASKKLDKKFCGIFTNYGHNNVDIFAPGVDIFSLYPNDTYYVGSGTSFAAPVVTGVAALVWSYFPDLTAIELKDILMKSGNVYAKKKVYQPGKGFANKQKVRFSELSNSGSVVNVNNALILAESYSEN